MATTPEEMKKSELDYANAYNEDAPARPVQSDDEAFGLGPEAGEPPAEEAAETPAQEAAEDTAEAGQPAGQTPMESKGDMPGDDSVRSEGESGGVPSDIAVPGVAAVEANSPVVVEKGGQMGANGAPGGGMTEQQLKSWEGRLKKAQAELDAKGKTVTETPAVEALEDVGEQAEDTNPALAEAAEAAADKVEDGSVTADQAMKQLAEDFGEDFVKMIEAVARKIAMEAGGAAATDKVGEVGKAVDDIIAHIGDEAAKKHFEQIAAAHPDFADIGASEGFKAYVDGLPQPGQAEAARVAGSGSAQEINALLTAYKATHQDDTAAQDAAADKPTADPVVSAQMDAAEGVRSSGMKLPESPTAGSASYEDAWNEFNS